MSEAQAADELLPSTAEQTPEPKDAPAADAGATENEGAEGAKEDPPKREKTPEERERARMQRGIDRRTRQLAEAQAEAAQLRSQLGLTRQSDGHNNPAKQDDSETLSLSRADLQKMIDDKARELAPTIRQQADEMEHRRSIVQGLAKEWGAEKFDSLASDLDDAFGGLADRSGKPKPATDAIFESEAPKALIEYLADPEHADEAEALSRMSAIQAGRAVAKLEIKLASEKAKAKPQASKAAAPLEPIRGSGSASGMPNPSDTKAYMRWANEQERKGLH